MAELFDFLGGGQAQGPGAMQQQNPLQRLLDPQVALPMAAALLGNRGNAGNFGAAFGAGGEAMGEQKKLQAQTAKDNKTYQFFQQSEPALAAQIDAGMPVGQAWEIYNKQRYAQEGTKPTSAIQEYEYARNNGQFDGSFTDWQTKGIREQDPTFKREQDLRKEYGSTPEFKRYDEVRASYERVRTSAQRGDGAGDLGTIYGFMKMLDPGSVVREGEFATASNSSGVPDRIRNLYNQVMEGMRLTPEQRSDFANTAQQLYENEQKRVESLNQRYTGIAGEYELDPTRIVQQPAKFEPLQIGGAPKDMGNGVTIRKLR